MSKEVALKLVKMLQDSDALCIDTETTGLTKDDHIIELAIVSFNTGEVVYTQKFRNKVCIHPRALEAHHITEESLKQYQEPAYYQATIQGILNSRVVVGYNVTFDWKMIQQSFNVAITPMAIVDAMMIYTNYAQVKNANRTGYKWFKLSDAAERSGIEIKQTLHSALGDTIVMRDLLRTLLKEKGDYEQNTLF